MTIPYIRLHRAAVAMSAMALAFTLVLPIACSGANGGATPEPPEVQGDLVAMLPASATTVGYVDVDALRGSQLYALVEEDDLVQADEGLGEFVAATGIDPRTDLHRVAFASSASIAAQGAGGESAMIAVASYDRDKLLATLQKAETSEHQGRTIYRLDSLQDADATPEAEAQEDEAEEDEAEEDESADDEIGGFLAILDDSTLLIGQEQAVRDILDVAAGSPSARSNAELMGLLEDVDPSSEIWVVSAREGILGELAPAEGMPMPKIPVDKVNAIIFSARLATGLDLTLRGRTGAEDDAKLLGDSLSGMLAFGKMMLQSNQPEIFAIVDRGVTAGSNGFDVTVKASLNIDELRALRDFAGKAMSPEGTAKSEG